MKQIITLLSVFMIISLLTSCVSDFIGARGSCRYGVLATNCEETTESKCDDLGGLWDEAGACH